MAKNIIIIGGGAAGFFGAIRAAESNPQARVTILEKSKDVLGKVRISGGGRCNVTHACWTPAELVKNYPRGTKELKGPFHRFMCGDTMEWYEKRGVELKIEDDGRIFPASDNSQTIIDCLMKSAYKAGIEILTRCRVDSLERKEEHWIVQTPDRRYQADAVLIATGSNSKIWEMLAGLGHSIVPPVPSLFTFNIKEKPLHDLAGISMPKAQVKVSGTKLSAVGPLLVTHWGMSGPAILKLSAWGARQLHEFNYSFSIHVNWINQSQEETRAELQSIAAEHAKKQCSTLAFFGLPQRLWKYLLERAKIESDRRWIDFGKKQFNRLTTELSGGQFEVEGKSTFKDEFVTAGGVSLREINFKTYESKLLPGLFLAGEVLNIDAITGGFNFQNAWTGGWIAGEAMAGSHD